MQMPEYDLQEAARKIKRWQRIAGMKGKTIAEQAGISAAYYSDISNGKQRGSIGVLARIAVVLGHQVDELFAGLKSPDPGTEPESVDRAHLRERLLPLLGECTDDVLECLDLWQNAPGALQEALYTFHLHRDRL